MLFEFHILDFFKQIFSVNWDVGGGTRTRKKMFRTYRKSICPSLYAWRKGTSTREKLSFLWQEFNLIFFSTQLFYLGTKLYNYTVTISPRIAWYRQKRQRSCTKFCWCIALGIFHPIPLLIFPSPQPWR